MFLSRQVCQLENPLNHKMNTNSIREWIITLWMWYQNSKYQASIMEIWIGGSYTQASREPLLWAPKMQRHFIATIKQLATRSCPSLKCDISAIIKSFKNFQLSRKVWRSTLNPVYTNLRREAYRRYKITWLGKALSISLNSLNRMDIITSSNTAIPISLKQIKFLKKTNFKQTTIALIVIAVSGESSLLVADCIKLAKLKALPNCLITLLKSKQLLPTI